MSILFISPGNTASALHASLPCLPWRDFLGKYRNVYIIYKSWQYSLSIACQVWARGATEQGAKPALVLTLELTFYN